MPSVKEGRRRRSGPVVWVLEAMVWVSAGLALEVLVLDLLVRRWGKLLDPNQRYPPNHKRNTARQDHHG